ncbi:MAG: hypothetical protein MJ223_01300 [Mycoplasmoidaceae bacterium]|nr:hypothetical protein [Mycoplasmoidaceae bacterium]
MKKIELEISDDLYDKYKENKQFCDRKFVKSIKYAYKESELKKLLESDRKTQHGLFTKLNTNLATIIMHLSVLAEYVASQRPSMIKSLNIQSIDQNKFLIFVQSIWLHTLCLINQIREMLQISNSSTNCQDIIFNNPFII